MREPSFLRLGAGALLAGTVLAGVNDVIVPGRPSETAVSPDYLNLIADRVTWVGTHVGMIIGLLLVILGLVALSRSVGGRRAGMARLGEVTALVGGTIGLVALGTKGLAMKEIAFAWAGASGAEQAALLAAARAVNAFQLSLATVSTVVYAGVTPILFGLALNGSDDYPSWLGWLALVAGVGGVVFGLVQAYGGTSYMVSEVLLGLVRLSLTIWTFVLGILLWRQASAAT